MRNVAKRVTFPAAILMCLIILQANSEGNRKVCSSVDVRNNISSLAEKLKGCTIVEGFVQIVLMEKAPDSDFLNITLPDLKEISQYLLVYRVAGLKSLAQLFPNLAIIRGQKLLGNAALAIYENAKLQEVGLYRLTHIMEGSVIINKNYNLCFANSIDWDVIMKSNNTNQTYYEVYVSKNKDPVECNNQEVCKESRCDRDLCWSKDHCQILQMDCHPLCAGGCHKPDDPDACFACKGFVTSQNKCVASCPSGSYSHLKLTCLTEAECRNKSVQNVQFFPFDGTCISECPSMYQKSRKNDTCISCDIIPCHKVCTALHYENTFRITSISETDELQSCTHVNGSLAIVSLTGNYNSGMESVLKRNLGMIEEISGQLKIMHSHALVSFNFLKNLRAISGRHAMVPHDTSSSDELPQQTLVVKDNKNLQKLWDWDKRKFNLTISGKLFFHYNPKLCISEINKLVEVANIQGVTQLDVSKESNGDQTFCSLIPFNVTVEKIASNSVILALHMSSNVSTDNIGRFVVFYKPSADTPDNQSMLYESASECGDNQWKVSRDAEANNSNGTSYILLPHLEPAVQYIYFVRSLHSTIETGPICTFTTLPAQPSVPLNVKENSVSDRSISLTWSPPLHPHGKLNMYVVRGYYESDRRYDLLRRDYCVNKLRNEVLASRPMIVSTTAAAVADSKCHCNTTVGRRDTARKCDLLDQLNNLDSFKMEAGVEVCDAYIYRLVESRGQMLHSMNDVQGIEFQEQDNKTEDIHDKYLKRNETGDDGKYNSFWFEVNANTTSISIDNLRHFSEYVVLVSACPDPQTRVTCSRDAIIAVRTEPSPDADRINPSKITVHVLNETANISWEEPKLVNSFVHCYILEYRTNVENAKFEERCVTAETFHANNDTYSLQNLPAGKYEFRIRAVSLFGEGPYVADSFKIEEHSTSVLDIAIFVIVLVLFGLLILSVTLYYVRWRLKKRRILFASVNPRYEPVYIEDKWEVSRENLVLVRQLGRGTFGSVHEGILKPDLRCAVKTTTAVGYEENQQFLKEATTMKEFHEAFHIVKLIGVISKVTPSYVIMELMDQGDLKSFLLKRGSDLCDDSKTLPESLLLQMVAQIADGMAYLESRKFVHRDLAARNCMVAADNTVKIGDFGLARDIYEHDYYRRMEKSTLPVRWMCPESLRDGVYTSCGDMWSFGVVLWEITTLAQMPYHPKTNEEVIKYVQAGNTLDIPDNTHEILKPIMRSCWRWSHYQRPRFVQILKILDPYLNKAFKKVSYFHNGADAKAADSVKPSKTSAREPKDECYLYTDENDELQLFLAQCPKEPTSGKLLSTSNSVRYIPNRGNGYIDGIT